MEPKNPNIDYKGMIQDNPHNLLPYDGIALYIPAILPPEIADHVFESMKANLSWNNDRVTLFGKTHVLSRMSAWYGDPDCVYTYGGIQHLPLPWTKDLLACKAVAENQTNALFNSCLCNLYHSGLEGMGWHSDDEKEMGKNPIIASFSFGASRIFRFRHKKTKQIVEITLEHGSMLIMKGECQHHWQHALPKTSKVKESRINLTLRCISIL